jgi:hypothetical protein
MDNPAHLRRNDRPEEAKELAKEAILHSWTSIVTEVGD